MTLGELQLLIMLGYGGDIESIRMTEKQNCFAVLQLKGLVGKTHIAPRGKAHLRQLKHLKLPEAAWLLASGEVVRRETTTS